MTEREIISKKAKRCLQQGKSQLVLNQPFFGNILLSQIYEECNTLPHKTMGVTGKKLLYDADFVVGLDSISELKGVLIHEVLHLALDHLSRLQMRDPETWNMAIDYVANLIVTRLPDVLLPKGGLLDWNYDGMSAEEVYDILIKEIEENKKSKSSDDGSSDDGSSDDGSSKSKDAGDKVGFRDYHGEVSEEESKQIKKIMLSSYEALTSQEKGDVPGSLVSIINQLKEPKVDWRQFIRSTIVDIFNKLDFSMSRGNRHFLHMGYWFPSLVGEENKLIIIAVDTSGSVSDSLLEDFASETAALLELSDKTLVMSCDADIQEVVETSKYSDLLKEARFSGRGGTSFDPVFNKIRELELTPDVLVYLTDGYANYPSVEPHYPVIWGIGKGGRRDDAPFGITLQIGDMS